MSPEISTDIKKKVSFTFLATCSSTFLLQVVQLVVLCTSNIGNCQMKASGQHNLG